MPLEGANVTTEELKELGNRLMRGIRSRELRVPSHTHHSISLFAYAKQHNTSKENILKALESLRDTKQITLTGVGDDWTVTLIE